MEMTASIAIISDSDNSYTEESLHLRYNTKDKANVKLIIGDRELEVNLDELWDAVDVLFQLKS